LVQRWPALCCKPQLRIPLIVLALSCQWRSQFAARLIPQAAVVNIVLRTWFNTLMHVVNESSGGEHPAAFLLAGVLARRMACRGDSHPAKRAMHSERKLFCVR